TGRRRPTFKSEAPHRSLQMAPHSMNSAYFDRGSQGFFAIDFLKQCIRSERVSHRRRYSARSKHKIRGRKMTVDTDRGKKAEEQPGFLARLHDVLNVIPAHTWYASPS